MTTPSILGLSHVSLSVRDRAAARDFWVEAPDDLPIELFGMKPEFATELGVDVSAPMAVIG